MLWNDRLPSGTELLELKRELTAQRTLSEPTLSVLRRAAERTLPPMDALRLGADTLSLSDEATSDLSKPAEVRRAVPPHRRAAERPRRLLALAVRAGAYRAASGFCLTPLTSSTCCAARNLRRRRRAL